MFLLNDDYGFMNSIPQLSAQGHLDFEVKAQNYCRWLLEMPEIHKTTAFWFLVYPKHRIPSLKTESIKVRRTIHFILQTQSV